MKPFCFLFPREGDLLFSDADGTPKDGTLHVVCKLLAPEAPTVQGSVAAAVGDHFEAEIALLPGIQTITATLPDGASKAIRVLWLRLETPVFHLTVDDCIRCLEDLTRHTPAYPSLFDQPYFALFHGLHASYNAKVHMNLFYETEDGSFNLSMVTERYREEFRASSDWLSFSFHAVREFPDRPYQAASYCEVASDCALVTEQIRRFAGPEVLHGSTTLHWGAATLDGTRALRDAGCLGLCSYLDFDENKEPLVSYYLTADQVDYARTREGLADFEEGLFFIRLDQVLDRPICAAKLLPQVLEDLASRPHSRSILAFVIHEQYFYPDYHHYEPDYSQRIRIAAKWAFTHGYRSVSLTDLLTQNCSGDPIFYNRRHNHV